jgi:hypothetical protein
MITIKSKGNFKKFTRFLKRSREESRKLDPDSIGKKFCDALAEATPVDSGLTADSWEYEINKHGRDYTQIIIKNTNIQNGVNVALMVNYGHIAPNGTWVEGADYIAPTLRELYINVVNNTWKEIEKL